MGARLEGKTCSGDVARVASCGVGPTASRLLSGCSVSSAKEASATAVDRRAHVHAHASACVGRLGHCDCKRCPQRTEQVSDVALVWLIHAAVVRVCHRMRTTLHARSRTGRSAADAPDGATLTQLRAPRVLCRCWQRRDAALIEHLREATGQDIAPCFRDKLDLACSVVRNYDISFNNSGIRSPADRRFPS